MKKHLIAGITMMTDHPPLTDFSCALVMEDALSIGYRPLGCQDYDSRGSGVMKVL